MSRDQTQRPPPQDMAGPSHATCQPPAMAPQDVGVNTPSTPQYDGGGGKSVLTPKYWGYIKAVGGAGWAPCQVCLSSSPEPSPGARGYTQRPAQASEHPSAPPAGGSSCQPSLSTASAAFSGLAQALPSPLWGSPPFPFLPARPPPQGCGNAAPGVGHSELVESQGAACLCQEAGGSDLHRCSLHCLGVAEG